jgi:hypothetical protein
MRSKLFVFVLVFIAYSPCYAEPLIVGSVGGASDREIHSVVQEEARRYGYVLQEGVNYLQNNAARMAVGFPYKARELRDKVNTLASKFREPKSNLSLLLVGKSSGAIQIWSALEEHYSHFDDFYRIALVLIDPHGASGVDDRTGSYKDSRDLWWPSHWPSNKDFFRVYHIYQQREGLTGANFPDRRVYRSVKLSKSGVNHTNIPMQPESRSMIRDAINFASGDWLDWLFPALWLY